MALSRERNTSMIGDGLVRELPAKAATVCLSGGIAVLDAGVVAPARTATGLVALGRIEATADNAAGAAGAIRVKVRRGIFGFANKADDPVVAADIGADCYLVDDETVAHSSGSGARSIAGKVFQLDGDTVFVEFR